MATFELKDPAQSTPADSGMNISRATTKFGISYPTLATRRFRFRPFVLSDITPLATLGSEHRIADTTIGVPHPYTTEFARMWISSHSADWEDRRALH
jgi:hypothetical protein